VMTPGMVELGSRAAEENFKYGARIATVADKVILVNELNRQHITDGLIAGGFSEENIIFSKTLEGAKELFPTLLKSGDVLLIANDLPDNFR